MITNFDKLISCMYYVASYPGLPRLLSLAVWKGEAWVRGYVLCTLAKQLLWQRKLYSTKAVSGFLSDWKALQNLLDWYRCRTAIQNILGWCNSILYSPVQISLCNFLSVSLILAPATLLNSSLHKSRWYDRLAGCKFMDVGCSTWSAINEVRGSTTRTIDFWDSVLYHHIYRYARGSSI